MKVRNKSTCTVYTRPSMETIFIMTRKRGKTAYMLKKQGALGWLMGHDKSAVLFSLNVIHDL